MGCGLTRNTRLESEVMDSAVSMALQNLKRDMEKTLLVSDQPGLTIQMEKADVEEHGELFRGLWREALSAQKEFKVIWNLGFRGRGWEMVPIFTNGRGNFIILRQTDVSC